MLMNNQVGPQAPQDPSTQLQLMQQALMNQQAQAGGTGTAATSPVYSPWQGAAAMLTALTTAPSVGATSTPLKDIFNTFFGSQAQASDDSSGATDNT